MPYQDAIDASSVRIVNAFPDMAQWPITAGITRVELRPGLGVVVHHVGPTPQWPDFHLDNDPAAGLVRSTLCAGFHVGGAWWMSGFMNWWEHGNPAAHQDHGGPRRYTGAHPLELATEGGRKGWNNWQANWCYGGWGPLDTYVPKPGDLMAIMLAAGGTRMSKTLTVRERTQIVTVPLVLNGEWDFQPAGGGITPGFSMNDSELLNHIRNEIILNVRGDLAALKGQMEAMEGRLARIEEHAQRAAEQLERGFDTPLGPIRPKK